MRKSADGGVSQKALAVKNGVSETTIRNIINNDPNFAEKFWQIKNINSTDLNSHRYCLHFLIIFGYFNCEITFQAYLLRARDNRPRKAR